MAAWRKADRSSLIRLAQEQAGADAEKVLAELALSVRRSNIAVLGDSDVFVTPGPDGQPMRQVRRVVRLSVADGTLYQITVNRPFKHGTDEMIGSVDAYKAENGDRSVQWRAVPLAPGQGTLTYPGLQALNAAVGLATFQPRTQDVLVRGELRSVPNPYTEYDVGPDGQQGELLRFVMRVMVLGPTPLTGALAAVEYVLDVQPRQHLQRALLALLNGGGGGLKKRKRPSQAQEEEPEDCGVALLPHSAARAKIEAGTHAWVPLYLGLGLVADLTHPAVLNAVATFHEQMMMESRRAQTVIMRNALLRHPALGPYKTVAVNAEGVAQVSVLAWMADAQARQSQQRALVAMMESGRIDTSHQLDVQVETVQSDVLDMDADATEPVPVLAQLTDTGLDNLRQQASALRERLPRVYCPSAPLDTLNKDELEAEIRRSSALIEE